MLEAVNVSMESLNLATLAPMLISIAGALMILAIDLIKGNLDKSFYIILTVLFLLLDMGAVLGFANSFAQNGTMLGLFDVMMIDGLAIIAQLILIGASMLFIILSMTSKRFHEYNYPEYFALYLFMIAGFQFMVATDNLILIFVGLETSSLALYTMIAMHNRSKSFEAAVKYFTMGALAADAYGMILDAMNKCVDAGKASDDKECINTNLRGTKNYKGITGVININENGDAVKSAVVNAVKDGKFAYKTTVNP